MRVTLLGMGPSAHSQLTAAAAETLAAADAVLGAPRLIQALPGGLAAHTVAAARPEQVMDALAENPGWQRPCVALSGDVGFYSGAKKLLALLSAAGHEAELLCGISTPQYFAARLGRSWESFQLVSGHHLACNVLAEVLNHTEVFFLTDKIFTPAAICEALYTAGLGEAQVWVGENLSAPDERITAGTVAELRGRLFAPLCAVLVENHQSFCRLARSPGIADDAFIRGEVPMTKREVRAVALSLLGVREDDVLFDIGAGTGSVAVEMALLARRGQVFAIEANPVGQALIERNRAHFGTYNLTLVRGMAPLALAGLPAPSAAFIGGSKGQMSAIMAVLLEQNPAVRLVASAASVESLSAALESMKALAVPDIEIVQVAASRGVERGGYHMLAAQNPIFLIAGGGSGGGGHA